MHYKQMLHYGRSLLRGWVCLWGLLSVRWHKTLHYYIQSCTYVQSAVLLVVCCQDILWHTGVSRVSP